jgi:hypothetical protein
VFVQCTFGAAASPLKLVREIGHREWVQKYRWPIYFYVSVAFWNLSARACSGS